MILVAGLEKTLEYLEAHPGEGIPAGIEDELQALKAQAEAAEDNEYAFAIDEALKTVEFNKPKPE